MSIATQDRMTVEGHVSCGFEAVRETFADNFTRRRELQPIGQFVPTMTLSDLMMAYAF
jgi:hypothetical protein